MKEAINPATMKKRTSGLRRIEASLLAGPRFRVRLADLRVADLRERERLDGRDIERSEKREFPAD